MIENPFRPKPTRKNPFRAGPVNPFRVESVIPPERDQEFKNWISTNNITDLNEPDTHYDYRGAFLAGEKRDPTNGHWTDAFKLPGHESYGVTPDQRRTAAAVFQGSSELPGPSHPYLDPVEQAQSDIQHVPQNTLTEIKQIPGAMKQAFVSGTKDIGNMAAGVAGGYGSLLWGYPEKAQQIVEETKGHLAETPPQNFLEQMARMAGPYTAAGALGRAEKEIAGRAATEFMPRIEKSLEMDKAFTDLNAYGAADAQRGRMAGYRQAGIDVEGQSWQHAGHQELGNLLGDLHGQRNQGLVDQLRGIEASQQAGADWRQAGLGELGGLMKGRQTQLEGAANAEHVAATNPSEAGLMGRSFDEWLAQSRARQALLEAEQSKVAQQGFPEARSVARNYPGKTLQSAGAIGGALVGGVAGANSGDTERERGLNAILGAAAGGLTGHALHRRFSGNPIEPLSANTRMTDAVRGLFPDVGTEVPKPLTFTEDRYQPYGRQHPDLPTPEEIFGQLQRKGVEEGRVNPALGPGLWDLKEKKGGIPLKTATTLAGGAAGALHGYATADPEDSKLSRVVAQGLLGAAAGYGVAKGIGALGKTTASPLPPAIEPIYQRAAAQIDFGGTVQASMNKAAEGDLSVRIQKIAEDAANSNAPIERFGRQAEEAGLSPDLNPRHALSFVKSEDQTIKESMEGKGVPDPITRVPVGISFKQIWAPFKGDDEKIRRGITYVMAERGVARGPSAYGGNLAQYADDVALTNHFRGDQSMLDFRDRIETFVDALGSYAVRSGLWTPQQWAAIRASDAVYLPWKRVMEDFLKDNPHGTPLGQYANVTSGVKNMVGSGRMKADPALSLAEYAQAIIRRADRYRVGDHLFNAAEQLGPAGDLILSPTAPPATNALRGVAVNNAVARAQAAGVHVNSTTIDALDDLFTPTFDKQNPVIWRNGANGQREYRTVNAPALWRSVMHLNQLNDEGVRRFLDLTLRPLKRIFVAMTTGYSPRFAGGTNITRDITDALTRSQNKITLGDIAAGYAHAIGGPLGLSRLYDDAERFGLGSVSNYTHPTSPRSYQQMYAPTSRMDRFKVAAKQAASLPLKPFEALGQASDLGPRLGEYRAALRNKQGMVQSGQWSPDALKLYGATAGREVTIDFQNKPGDPVMHLLADYIPFFGPSMNSPVSFAGAARRNPGRVLMGALGTAVVPATIAWVMKHRSKDVLEKTNDRNPGERSAFLLFPMDDKGKVTIRVALGQELGLAAAGVTAGLDAWYDHDPNAAGVFVQAMKRALPPVGVPVIDALWENARNMRSFGNTPVEPHRLLELPPGERRLPTTNPTFDVMARAARGIGLSNTSPLQVENVVRSVLSNAGTPALTTLTDPIAEKLGGIGAERQMPTPWYQNPLIPYGSFYANPTPRTTASEQFYYDIRDKTKQAEAAATTTLKSGSLPDVERVLQNYGKDLDPVEREVVKQVDKVLKSIREGEVATQAEYRAGGLKPDAARKQLDEFQSQRQDVYRLAAEVLRHGK